MTLSAVDPPLPEWRWHPWNIVARSPWRLFDVHAPEEVRLSVNVVIEALASVPVVFVLQTSAGETLPIT